VPRKCWDEEEGGRESGMVRGREGGRAGKGEEEKNVLNAIGEMRDISWKNSVELRGLRVVKKVLQSDNQFNHEQRILKDNLIGGQIFTDQDNSNTEIQKAREEFYP